jgi:AraC-like DNA-binding protein
VLTIALEAGFGSLGAFNRAFKAQLGVTPTEYRHEKLRGKAQDPRAGGGS